MWPVERLHFEFKRRRISRTAARDAVYVALGRLGPCAIASLVRHFEGKVDATTVYRTMDLFLRIGVARRVRDGLVELGEPFRQHHHHFECRKCGRRIDFLDGAVERAVQKLSGSRWVLESHQLELTGVCRLCAGAAFQV